MSKTAKIISINERCYYKDKNTNEVKSKYDKVSRDLRYVLRANNADKSLSTKARILATNYYNMINNSDNGVIFISHNFISSISEVGNRQNNNLHRELLDLFHIQYHQSVIIDSKKYRDGFTIKFTENTEIILKNPKQFYSIKTEINCDLEGKKFPPSAKKISTPLYIYKEKPINKPIEYSYIANGDLYKEKPPEEKKSDEANQANFLDKKFILKDFYPLTQEDASNLRVLSGRSFELLPMNEILLKIHNYLTAKGSPIEFNDKDHFLNYFAKRLASEKRDAYKINNVSFRINANITDEEKEAKQRNKYLQEKEDFGNTFEKFIVSCLSERKAYDFLRAFRSLDIEGNIAKISLAKHIELSENDLKLILEEIQIKNNTSLTQIAYGGIREEKPSIDKIELITQNSTKQVNEMLDINQQIRISFGDVRGQEILNICTISERSDKAIQVEVKTGEEIPENDKHLLRQCIKTIYGEGIEIKTKPKAETNVIHLDQRDDTNWPLWETRVDIWEKFKKGILEQLRQSEGEHIFKAWFDKLKRSQDHDTNKLTLTGSDFFISHIASNFERLIENTSKNKKINITLVYEGREGPGYRPIVFTPTGGRKF
jgi:hypothetical protein